MTLGKPTIGPRAYLASGPSGWLETFDRKLADAALQRLLGTVPIELAVEALLRGHKQAVTWDAIVKHLAGLVRVAEEAIEPAVVVALWAAIELAARQSKSTN